MGLICLVERRVREGAVGLLKAAHLKGPPCLPQRLFSVFQKSKNSVRAA